MFKTFSWVNTPREYELAVKNAVGQNIPVVKPACLKKQKEWECILQWYGLKLQDGVDAFEPDKLASINPNHIVICIGTAFLQPCIFFARQTQRPILQINSIRELDMHDLSAYHSILLIGETHVFSVVNTNFISLTLKRTWGLVTAADYAGISFLFTKMLCNGNAHKQGKLLINSIERLVTVEATNKRYFKYNPRTLPVLLKNSWEHICIFCHGGIAHLKLNTAVVCGNYRTAAFSPKIHTCSEHDDKRTCIRVHNKNIEVLYMKDFKAKKLYVLSCTSINFSAGLEPANVNMALSLIESYAASCVLANRNVSISADALRIVQSMIDVQMPQWLIADILNDVELNKNKSTPYVVIGDPADEYDQQSLFTCDTNIERQDRLLYLFHLPPQLSQQTIAVKHPGNFVAIRGVRYLVVLFKEISNRSFEITVEEEAFGLPGILSSAKEKYALLSAIADNVSGVIGHLHYADKKQLSTLNEITATIKLQVSLLANRMAGIGSTGLWDKSVLMIRKVMDAYIQLWQSAFSILLADHRIFDCLDALLASNATRTVLAKKSSCKYCGNELKFSKVQNTITGALMEEAMCHWCGEAGIRSWNANNIKISHQNKLEPGGTLDIKIKRKAGTESLPCIVSFFDKSIEKAVYHKHFTLAATQQEVHIQMPEELTNDLHTVMVVCMHKGDIYYHRSRVSVFYHTQPKA